MSALKDQGLAQQTTGKCVDVWRQTLIQDEDRDGNAVGLTAFHGGEIKILSLPSEQYRWPSNFSVAIYAVGVSQTDIKIKASDRLLVIGTAFYWREPLHTREVGAAGVEDLEFLYHQLVMGNETLVYKVGWPAPPASLTANTAYARRVPEHVPSFYDRFIDDDNEPCDEVIAVFQTAYVVRLAL